jgi:D-alanyl-D-alanine carboxypeptidase
MFKLVAAPDRRRYLGQPSYGLGLMADSASPWGLLVGHNGGGPCYSASAFHAVDLGGASVCVMAALGESVQAAEDVVFATLEHLGHERDRRAARHALHETAAGATESGRS